MRAGLALLVALIPGAAFAHAAERMVIQTLPTGWSILGAGLVVALTGLLALVRLPRLAARHLGSLRLLPRAATSWIAAAGWALLIAVGFLGSRDPFANLLPMTLWVLVWVGLTLASLVFGDLWRPWQPWYGPARALRRLIGWQGRVGISRLGHWPAVIGYFGFAWLEIVSLAPADPAGLARVVLAYALVILALSVAEGEDWPDRGEALSLYFALVSKVAPVWREGATWRAGPPGTQITAMSALPLSAAAFVTLVLAGVSFDGLSETFWWLARIGINPLEFPGRSAVQWQNTAGLAAMWAACAGSVALAVGLGRALGHRGLAGPVLLSFLPIAAGYHSAHYLVALLTQGQYALSALNDPLDRGWALLGLPQHWERFGFLADRTGVTLVWAVQIAAILGAHVLAVLLTSVLDAKTPSGPEKVLSHLPVTTVMVIYTALGLWLLSTPTGA
ncbi:hypothetical protein V8J36_00115 [Frigidibacter sp. MR17.14]|uniref:hypothetical protein n=1 Tax=Frigidibacter sp. MR17.14 TaxID=3126509 RepID=UPI003012DE57